MFTLAAWLHDLDPVALSLPGGLAIRWYGIAYIAGFAIAWWGLSQLAKRGWIAIPREAVGDVILATMIGVIIGGRLGYVLVYKPSLMLDFGGGFPWWGLFRINEGGMASHGGIVGAIAGAWFMARKLKLPLLHVLDCLALATPIGLMLGRLANFVNGELLGRIVAGPGEPAPWWAVRYPQELSEREGEISHTPAQTLELESLALEANVALGTPDAALTYGAIERAVQTGHAHIAERLAPLLNARHPSQLYQALAEGLVVLVVLILVWRKPRRAGIVGAWFLITYGVGRIATEFVRLPDAHFGASARLLGLSRGQWLSAAMVAIGAVMIWWVCRRADATRYGGWGTRASADEAGAEPYPHTGAGPARPTRLQGQAPPQPGAGRPRDP